MNSDSAWPYHEPGCRGRHACPQEQRSQHRFGALLGLVSLNLGLLTLGLVLSGATRLLAVLAIVAGAVGLTGLALFLAGAALPIGVSERLADYPGAATLIVLGCAVLLAARQTGGVRRS